MRENFAVLNSKEQLMTDEPIHRTGQEARGGDIILNTPARRAIFISGLVGMVILALLGFALV
ncbi:hypothetical protein LK12_00735 [Novosphingobium malaysiense]|uniref:Peptide ABC transporter permease n=1 Tax=Novosphingobium malaysiense TaxID=1348853 RepID=A0A0B1ZQS1_9SPHN|nr:hypothetical protein LK12_00735 [Novosphingobium malaysiense]